MKIRQTATKEMTWAEIQAMAANNTAADQLHPFDEIDLTLEGGEAATVVVAAIIPGRDGAPDIIRFAFKDCLEEQHRMNEEWTNKGGWPACEARTYLQENVLPRLPADLRAVIKPRTITCIVDGEAVTCEDVLWLFSETEVFGRGGESLNRGATDGPDELQMPIFMTERDRVKMHKGDGTWFWWTRSPRASNSPNFCNVSTDGNAISGNANDSYGVAPGFDI